LDWILKGMAEDGLENVRAEPVMVSRWIRGQESAELISPRSKQMKILGLRPRRTVRVVAWTAEEVGIYGGRAYAEAPEREGETHVLGIESDGGVFSPIGFGFTGSDEAFAILQEVGRILEPIGAGAITRGGGGADIGPMMERGMPGMGLNVDPTQYFWYHHTDADTLDKLDPEEVARCVAAMAVMAYVVADLPEPLPR
jgi:carboxypeptidase Q